MHSQQNINCETFLIEAPFYTRDPTNMVFLWNPKMYFVSYMQR